MQTFFRTIGVMSGTSLDGIDLAYCEFELQQNGKWKFEIKKHETIPYTEIWRKKLKNAPLLSGLDLSLLSVEYGHYTGQCIREFIRSNKLEPHFAAVHGHTVFHQPERKLTLQIGEGSAIAAQSGLPVITNFRTLDVALGGQGAPLVPIGDILLFSEYDYCLNLGGIANISSSSSRIAFDICPCNMALNFLAEQQGQDYDKDGEIARKGTVQPNLLAKMNALEYYDKKPPKSLGIEWFEKKFKPLLTSGATTEDLLATTIEHIAIQIAANSSNGKMLITGGGALNKFLMERIEHQTSANVVPAPENIINYKEALIFAFLGVLRLQQQTNTLASVTGATKDSTGGSIYLP
ncbi:MAG: anhydro-N-acetylmuramic acid kinase [Bacteroidales bacterium]|jgi:anhydro-N-acetylmuramic acid kinase|nr:anhydro-N-acetylmuramic acid kinase [Bacteroidales bacterium]